MKLQLKTFALAVSVSVIGLVATVVPVTHAGGNTFSKVATWYGASCPTNGTLACLKYDMEIRHDLVNNKYYAWGQVYEGDDQEHKVQVKAIQIDKINLGNNSGVLTSASPAHSTTANPRIVGTMTPEIATAQQTQLAERVYYSVRYNDARGTLLSGQTVLLKFGQKRP